jgi:hypothetical protein
MGKNNGTTRALGWSCIVYPESAPDNWRDILDDLHLEWIESPLHDQDLNATGELKKAHWHVLILFGSVKSYDQVKELTEALNCPSPQKCHNSRALVRYMAHIDNPDKAQYNVSDIVGHGGVDISELLKPSSSERYFLIREMIEFVKSAEIIEYQDLMDYAAENRFDDWFPLLCDNSTIVINSYIKSSRHRKKRTKDFGTGEIIE